MSGLLATAALPLLLTGCMAVRPDLTPTSGGAPAHGGPDAGHTPLPAVQQNVPPAVSTPEPLPTSHLDLPAEDGPRGAQDAADRTKPPERQTRTNEGARPQPQPGLAADQRHETRRPHHAPASQPVGSSPGWPGAGPNACSAAAALGIFAPHSNAEHACQNLAHQERPYLHGHHG